MIIKTKLAIGLGIFAFTVNIGLQSFKEVNVEDFLMTKSYAA